MTLVILPKITNHLYENSLLHAMVFMSCVISTGAFALDSQASISSIVSEETGNPVSVASVSIRNEATGFTTSTATNSKGEYIFNQLPLGGPYSLNISYTGFGTQKTTGFLLNLGDEQKTNIKIESSSLALQTVEISSSGVKNSIPTLGASSSISAKNITKLPVNGRNFTSFIYLSPLSRGGKYFRTTGNLDKLFVFDGTYKYFKDVEISFSYTRNETKDNISYNGNVANSATLALPVKYDIRDLNHLSASDNQFKNKVIVYGTLPTFYGVSVGIRYSGFGGSKYSMIVSGNINGDFVASSYNYIVNPNAGIIVPSENPHQVQIGIRYGF